MATKIITTHDVAIELATELNEFTRRGGHDENCDQDFACGCNHWTDVVCSYNIDDVLQAAKDESASHAIYLASGEVVEFAAGSFDGPWQVR